MKYYTLFAAVAIFASVALFQGVACTKIIKHDFSELTHFERILFRSTQPDLYNALSTRSSNKGPGINFENEEILLFDIPILALQLSKSGSMRLPSAMYEFYLDFCFEGCVWFLLSLDYKEPEIRNANLTRFDTKINATNLELDFHIPDFQVIMDKFSTTYTDFQRPEVKLWTGLICSITNYTLKLAANLEYVPDVGVQISGVEMNFGVDSYDYHTGNGTQTFPNGTVVELDPLVEQFADSMNEVWIKVKTNVTEQAETSFNCFLSNGRNGDSKCEEILKDQVKMSYFVKLLESVGLGISKENIAEENSVAKVTNGRPLPTHLPEFPFPSIESTLLDFPLMLLQFGNVAGATYYNITSPFMFFSYDFTWDKCNSVGECRKTHENLRAPVFAAFLLDFIQVDFQPKNFSYSLNTPSAYLTCEDLWYESTDVESGFQEIYLGLNLTVADAEFAISGDYEFIEGVGFKVTNLDITLSLGEVQMRFPQYFTVSNGQESEIEEYKINIAPQIMEMWREVDEDGVNFERRYEEYIQGEINSLLSDGQSLSKLPIDVKING